MLQLARVRVHCRTLHSEQRAAPPAGFTIWQGTALAGPQTICIGQGMVGWLMPPRSTHTRQLAHGHRHVGIMQHGDVRADPLPVPRAHVELRCGLLAKPRQKPMTATKIRCCCKCRRTLALLVMDVAACILFRMLEASKRSQLEQQVLVSDCRQPLRLGANDTNDQSCRCRKPKEGDRSPIRVSCVISTESQQRVNMRMCFAGTHCLYLLLCYTPLLTEHSISIQTSEFREVSMGTSFVAMLVQCLPRHGT